MQARGEDRYRSAVRVVGDIGDELIVERQRRPLVAVVPAPPSEYPDVVGKRLLEIQVVAVFGLGPPGLEDGIVRIEARIDQGEIDGLAVTAREISVGPDRHAKFSRA